MIPRTPLRKRRILSRADRRRKKTQALHAASALETLEARTLLSATAFEHAMQNSPHSGHEAIPASATMSIVNGQETSGFPSVGMVGDTTGFFCSATLISPYHVLTAAHCAEGLGDTQGRFQVGGTVYSTSRVILHPEYNSNQIGTDQANDIAIYELNQAVSGIEPSSIYRSTPQVGELLTLVGFGAGGTGDSGHNGDFGTKRVGTTPIDQVSATLVSWNFDDNTESNTAPGDSGGPAFLEVNGQFLVAGVTSGGDRADAGIGDFSFDTRVDAYVDWIDSIVNNTNPEPPGPDPDDHSNSTDSSATDLVFDSSGQASDTGVLEIVGDRDVFEFTLDTSGSVTIDLQNTDGSLDTFLYLYDSAGNEIGRNDDGGNGYNSRLEVSAEAGTYYIGAAAYADGSTGRYRVDVAFTPDSTPEPPSDDDHGDVPDSSATDLTFDAQGSASDTGILETMGDRDYFEFSVTTDGIATIDLQESDGALDTFLYLHDASGNEIARDDDGGTGFNSRLEMDLAAGTYFIGAAAHMDASAGSYSLDVSFVENSTPEPPPSSQDVILISAAAAGVVYNPDGSSVRYDDSDILEATISDNGDVIFQMLFDGSDVGLSTNGEDIDAFAMLPDGSLLISTTGNVSVPGVLGDRTDLLRFDPVNLGTQTGGYWQLYMDGSDLLLDSRAGNIDAVSVLDDGSVVFSTAGTVNVDGFRSRDEDLIRFLPTSLGENTSGQLSPYFDGSDVGLGQRPEDIDGFAVGENGEILISMRSYFETANVMGDGFQIYGFDLVSSGNQTAGQFDDFAMFDGWYYDLDVDAVSVIRDNAAAGGGSGEGYQIDLRFVDQNLSESQQALFNDAVERWTSVITTDIPDTFVDGLFVDDLVIDVSAPAIDGSGGILGQAGPTWLRSSSLLPSRGVIEFDLSDVAQLEANGDLLDVITHEMGHVLGLGTIWSDLGLVIDTGAGLEFTGTAATAEYNSLFEVSASGVPVETEGGAGTAGGHWDEDLLGSELMTGFLDSGKVNSLSRITAASLIDIGYSVNLANAESYSPLSRTTVRSVEPTGDKHGLPGMVVTESSVVSVDVEGNAPNVIPGVTGNTDVVFHDGLDREMNPVADNATADWSAPATMPDDSGASTVDEAFLDFETLGELLAVL